MIAGTVKNAVKLDMYLSIGGSCADKDPYSKTNILMLVADKSDGSITLESEVYTLSVD